METGLPVMSRLTISDLPYPDVHELVDPLGLRNKTTAEIMAGMEDAVDAVMNVHAVQDACDHTIEHHEWSINRGVITEADICTKCGAHINQTFTMTMEPMPRGVATPSPKPCPPSRRRKMDAR